jgi:outer membrane immunogenic protein
MRRYLLAGLGAIAFGLTAPASAADLPVRPAAVAPVFSWTGFYIGGNAGYSWGETDFVYLQPIFSNTFVGTLKPDGFIGGGQIGFNWQTGIFVLGVEADFAWRSGATDTVTFGFANGIDFVDFHAEQKWVATGRGRVGVGFENWLLYVTGGVAWADFNHSYTERRVVGTRPLRHVSGSEDKFGWTVGAGVEWGFGNWSLGVEYLYIDFEDHTVSVGTDVIGGVLFPPSSTTFEDIQHVVRGKLNWRFPVIAPAPVVARN